MGLINFTGKKGNQNNYGEAWKVIAILVTLNNMWLFRLGEDRAEERAGIRVTVSQLKLLLDDPAVLTKMTALIMQSSTSRAIYYLYLTLRQLGYHTAVFQYIQKALKDYQSIKYRPYFLYLQHAINDGDLSVGWKQRIVDLIERAYKAN